ncbi:MAG: XdhC/CoxI family protein [Desulfohalobiaceae bacterium]|nr:XdhC/CoxI family protein [Desulfohalobiaceae bacterium]
MQPIEQNILELLEAGESLVLATVSSHTGSTPRTAGARMVVRADGTIIGTIGGGLVEAKTIQAAEEIFSNGQTRELNFDLSRKDVARDMDLICGGKTRIRLEYLSPDKETIRIFREQSERLQASRKSLYLFGAGHVAQQTAALANLVDFRVKVLDDREEFANRDRFPEAEEIRVLDSFSRALEGLAIDANSFLLILTRGHSFDRTVLAQALCTTAGYIGMIGSKNKRNTIYASLLEEGFTRNDLARVYCPVGLEIKAETPAEIGLSIVAQLVAIRAQG